MIKRISLMIVFLFLMYGCDVANSIIEQIKDEVASNMSEDNTTSSIDNVSGASEITTAVDGVSSPSQTTNTDEFDDSDEDEDDDEYEEDDD